MQTVYPPKNIYQMLEINFGSFPVLNTPRLVLREMANEDAAPILAQRSNPQTMKYLDRPYLKELEGAREFIAKIHAEFLQNIGISWMITLEETNEAIGTVGLWRFDKPNHRAEIGYMLLPQYWGKGIGTEALQIVLLYAFDSLKLHAIEANVNPENVASKRLLEKLGFRQEAYFRENYYFDGRFLDSVIYCLLASDLTPVTKG